MSGQSSHPARWPVTVGFLVWFFVMGASSAWDHYRRRPARLIERFDYYLTRWNVDQDRPEPENVADWIEALGGRAPTLRWQAAERLGDRAAVAATPAMIAALRDEQGTARPCQIAHNLGRIGDRSAVPALIQAISHPRNADLRVCATMALGDIGDARALEPLIASYEERGSLASLHSIAYLADPRAVPFLDSVAQTSLDEMHRHAAEHGLRLMRMLHDVDPVGALLDALPDLPERSTIWAIGHLVAFNDDRAVDSLYQLASGADQREEVRICAAAALVSFEAHAAVIRNLASGEDALSCVLGGLAAHRVGDSTSFSIAAARGAVERSRLVSECLTLVATPRRFDRSTRPAEEPIGQPGLTRPLKNANLRRSTGLSPVGSGVAPASSRCEHGLEARATLLQHAVTAEPPQFHRQMK